VLQNSFLHSHCAPVVKETDVSHNKQHKIFTTRCTITTWRSPKTAQHGTAQHGTAQECPKSASTKENILKGSQHRETSKITNKRKQSETSHFYARHDKLYAKQLLRHSTAR
jgi:hypothetical protein